MKSRVEMGAISLFFFFLQHIFHVYISAFRCQKDKYFNNLKAEVCGGTC